MTLRKREKLKILLVFFLTIFKDGVLLIELRKNVGGTGLGRIGVQQMNFEYVKIRKFITLPSRSVQEIITLKI